MEANLTTELLPPMEDSFFNKYMRSINLTLSAAGILCNCILLIVLFLLNRHQCTTYFLLILMALCDFLYCVVYTSILLTIDNYLNIINHQILCPLSFFLSPFTFTGSTLLLFICLLHLITNYIRKYNTILGQVGGRLSVVFVFAFIIIRSVLGSTSIELMSDPTMPHTQHCTIDMNTPDIVTKVQDISHIFAEVTDILVYIGWIIIFLMYVISLFRSKQMSKRLNESNRKKLPLRPFLMVNKDRQQSLMPNNQVRLTNKERHNNVSFIILSISFISILFYLPVMINKFITMNFISRDKILLTDRQISVLQVIQQTTHLFCLTIRFIPYCIFDMSIRSSIHRMVGMKIERKKKSKTGKYQQKYMCHCRCYRRQKTLELHQTQADRKQAEV